MICHTFVFCKAGYVFFTPPSSKYVADVKLLTSVMSHSLKESQYFNARNHQDKQCYGSNIGTGKALTSRSLSPFLLKC